MARKDRLIQDFAEHRQQQLASGPFKFIRAQARFLDAHTVALSNHETLTAKHFVLSTGSIVAPPSLPGLREIGLWGVPSRGLDNCFPELGALKDECRFADCSHLIEPDCAVREALKTGGIDASRYDSYRKLLEEATQAEKY